MHKVPVFSTAPERSRRCGSYLFAGGRSSSKDARTRTRIECTATAATLWELCLLAARIGRVRSGGAFLHGAPPSVGSLPGGQRRRRGGLSRHGGYPSLRRDGTVEPEALVALFFHHRPASRMDPTHSGGDMSPLYVPRKRKSSQSQPRGAAPCPVVQRMPERSCALNPAGFPQDDESEALKTRRTYGRKRYEDLQSVSMGTVDYPTTNCSVMSSGCLANGANPGSMAPPSARLPPRPAGKDAWPQGRPQPQHPGWNPSMDRAPNAWAPGRDRPQEQVWTAGRERAPHPGHEQTWIPGRDLGPEQGWPADRGRGRDQVWTAGRDPGREGPSQGPEQAWGSGRSQDQGWGAGGGGDRGPVWRHDLNMKKVHRVETERDPPVGDSSRPPDGRDANSSRPSPSEDKKPPVPSTKKEPPTYPPGSQEEQWQLQIVAKGRVACPKCKSVSRKTVEGLKKHLENCRLLPFTCPHCGKQLKSSTGMKYHVMADHSHLPSADDAEDLDDRAIKDKLRKILKRLGKLKCSKEGCNAAFTSIMGYVYHMKKCGKEESELEKMLLNCSHCGKAYRSKAGLEYHLRSEHAPTPQKSEEEEAPEARREADPERTASGRVQRASAQVANFHLAEIANNDLPKDWPKRKFQSDLVPDDKKLKYARPGLPAFSQEVLRKWKNEVKLQRKVHCPNQGCCSTYTSVSGLKAHLGLCCRGDFEAGKYRCLICNKEFNSESGVKYHINSVHSQDWFVTNKKASKKFEKFLKNQPKEVVHNVDKQVVEHYQHHQQHHHHHHLQQHLQLHHHHQQQLEHPPMQHPLQPPHHLQLLHPEHQGLDPQLHHRVLHFTPVEHPPGPMWVDAEPGGAGPEQAPIEMDTAEVEEDGVMAEGSRGERGKADGRRRDCYAFGGGVCGGSSCQPAEQQRDRPRPIDQWSSRRPGAAEAPPPRGWGGSKEHLKGKN